MFDPVLSNSLRQKYAQLQYVHCLPGSCRTKRPKCTHCSGIAAMKSSSSQWTGSFINSSLCVITSVTAETIHNMHAHIRTHTCIHVHTYTRTHTHTYTHVYARTHTQNATISIICSFLGGKYVVDLRCLEPVGIGNRNIRMI